MQPSDREPVIEGDASAGAARSTRSPGPWQLYDALIQGIPEGITVTDCAVSHWTYVATDLGSTGLAMTTAGGPPDPERRAEVVGRDLRAVAAYARSWDLTLASIGVAAINSWYNTEDQAGQHGARTLTRGTSTFENPDRLDGRRVATVGHFTVVEQFADRCTLTVLERSPHGQDLPDSACEYVLADQEVVFITGSSLVNKTLPRLLALCSRADVTLVGPSTPIAPDAFRSTVDEIAGTIVVDHEQCRRIVRTHGGSKGMRDALRHVSLRPVAPERATVASGATA